MLPSDEQTIVLSRGSARLPDAVAATILTRAVDEHGVESVGVEYEYEGLKPAEARRLAALKTQGPLDPQKGWNLELEVRPEPPACPEGFVLRPGDRAQVFLTIGWYDVEVTDVVSGGAELKVTGAPHALSLATLTSLARPTQLRHDPS